jgi:hypothetical protein
MRKPEEARREPPPSAAVEPRRLTEDEVERKITNDRARAARRQIRDLAFLARFYPRQSPLVKRRLSAIIRLATEVRRALDRR